MRGQTPDGVGCQFEYTGSDRVHPYTFNKETEIPPGPGAQKNILLEKKNAVRTAENFSTAQGQAPNVAKSGPVHFGTFWHIFGTFFGTFFRHRFFSTFFHYTSIDMWGQSDRMDLGKRPEKKSCSVCEFWCNVSLGCNFTAVRKNHENCIFSVAPWAGRRFCHHG